jgi:hypothetical protein
VNLREQEGIAARARIRHSHSRQDKFSARRVNAGGRSTARGGDFSTALSRGESTARPDIPAKPDAGGAKACSGRLDPLMTVHDPEQTHELLGGG